MADDLDRRHDEVAVGLSGTPFEEEIGMWWSFIRRNHDDIVRASVRSRATSVSGCPPAAERQARGPS
ncbi:hypothetical protein ACFWN1_27445 [Streptomyces sp. NPDC058459]|uniref:hypothetical protein n=1 Tax=Streptomyces sp. NPDC058459 TaxID=3346508 RepID=UPI003656725D